MVKPVLEVEGGVELRKALRYIGDDGLKKELKQAHGEIASLVAREAQALAPVRSGRLKSTVKPLSSMRDARVKVGGARAPYTTVIHWGRGSGNVGRPPGNRRGRNPVKARRFGLEAVDRSRTRAIAVYERAMDRLLAKLR